MPASPAPISATTYGLAPPAFPATGVPSCGVGHLVFVPALPITAEITVRGQSHGLGGAMATEVGTLPVVTRLVETSIIGSVSLVLRGEPVRIRVPFLAAIGSP